MKKKEDKRKKFHDALLNFYHPPPPPPPPPPPYKEFVMQVKFDEELLMLRNGDMSFNLDPVSDDGGEEENSAIDGTDCESKKLTRAQRKRIRKGKLKEAAASVRRKIIGPVFPSDYDDSREEHSSGNNMKTFQENSHNGVQDKT